MSNRIYELIIELLKEAEQTWLNPKTGNQVGYARALQLGLVHNEPQSKTKAPAKPAAPTKKASSIPIPAKKSAPEKPKQWWSKYTQYKLNAYPMGVPEKSVKVDFTGDINSKAVMSWKSPKTGRTVYSYTQKFLQKNADMKWDRIKGLKPQKVEGIKNKTNKILSSPRADDKIKQAAAIIGIIAHTGLRVGSVSGFEDTGNRGVSTLGPDNISIKGDLIKLNFVGKSYQDNQAQVKDATLAAYLGQKIKERRREQFLFDIPKSFIDQVYDEQMDMGEYKIKDLRTYVATKVATQILFEDKTPPPPLPAKQTEIKKLVKDKLQGIFNRVSEILNNTPAMAKTSYVHPAIIYGYLDRIGVEAKHVGYNVAYKQVAESVEPLEQGDSAFDDCDEYPLPIWWDSSDWDLFPKQ